MSLTMTSTEQIEEKVRQLAANEEDAVNVPTRVDAALAEARVTWLSTYRVASSEPARS